MASAFAILQSPGLTQRGPLARWNAARAQSDDPCTAVVRAAWGAATVGEAFFAGYQGALETLIPGVGTKALLVTEPQGQHPRQLTTTLQGDTVHGSKAFAMTGVDVWWVLAVAERAAEGHRDLRLVRVEPQQIGITVTPLRTDFVADVPHGSVVFDGAVAGRTLEDAWNRVVRPFRCAEDAGVLLAVTTALLGAAVEARDQDALLGVFASLVQIFGHTDDLHFRALMGVRRQLIQIADQAPLDGPLATAWSGWRPLVDLGRRARTVRLERAREHAVLDPSSPSPTAD